MSRRWTIAYRVGVLALLSAIAVQVGVLDWVSDSARSGVRAISSIGKPQELPAPAAPNRGPSFDDMYQSGTDAALLDLARRSASAPSGR